MLRKMELKEGVGVFTTDDKQVGKINRFILDPSTKEVTHIVVQKGWLFPEDKLVPFYLVSSATDEKVVLDEDASDFADMPPFNEEHFVRITDEDIDVQHPTYTILPAYYPYPPLGYGGYPDPSMAFYIWTSDNPTSSILEDRVPLKVGATVMSSDDENVGVVERLFVETESNKVTHFVIRHGLLLKERKLIPVQWVKLIGEKQVQLLISAQLLGRVRAYEE